MKGAGLAAVRVGFRMEKRMVVVMTRSLDADACNDACAIRVIFAVAVWVAL